MTNDRLKVTIVGAGLCGLAVGAHLRKFADVTVSITTIRPCCLGLLC